MKLEVGDLITLNNGDKYITLDKITYNDKSYFFVNKVTSETKEPTEEFYVFTIKDDKFLKIENHAKTRTNANLYPNGEKTAKR